MAGQVKNKTKKVIAPVHQGAIARKPVVPASSKSVKISRGVRRK